MKKNSAIKNLFLGIILCGTLCILSGCTSLSYISDDYDVKNTQTVQTSELFTFSTYTKTSNTENIQMKLGVAKTPLPDALVVYVNIKNNSSVADYVFYLKDFIMKAGNETLSAIPPSAYINAYQSYETGTYNGLSNIAPTLGAFADIQNAYHNVTSMNNTAASKSSSTTAVSNQIGSIANGISNHTITSASVVKTNSSNFFYIFLKDPNTLPINFAYKDLTFSFGEANRDKNSKSSK